MTPPIELPPMRGASVPDCVAQLHAVLRPRSYLELGTTTRQMLALARCASVAVGVSRTPPPTLGGKPTLFVHPGGSRDFFARFDPTQLLGGPVDLAVIDGDRLFDGLLRDFIAVERHAAPHAVVALMNAVPLTLSMATRDQEATTAQRHPRYPGWWTGDVWKAVDLLLRHRPDLTVTALDAQPTGLILVTGLDPASTVLADRFDALVAEAASRPEPASFAAYLDRLPLAPTADIGRLAPLHPAEAADLREAAQTLILDFESLGEDCELGLAQRQLGQEPLSLLRFASLGTPYETRLRRTIAALDARFEGLGTPGTIRTDPPDAPPARERMLVDRLYDLAYHGFVPDDVAVSLEAMAQLVAAQTPHLRFLRRKLLVDLAEGDKLFVWKSHLPHPVADVRALLHTVRRFGPGWLLWIGHSDADHPPGFVELAEPGLIRGYVSRFIITAIPIDEWVEVVVRAHALWRTHHPAR